MNELSDTENQDLTDKEKENYQIIKEIIESILDTTFRDMIYQYDINETWNMKFWELVRLKLDPILKDEFKEMLDVFNVDE